MYELYILDLPTYTTSKNNKSRQELLSFLKWPDRRFLSHMYDRQHLFLSAEAASFMNQPAAVISCLIQLAQLVSFFKQ
jgi:hypothetical protein